MKETAQVGVALLLGAFLLSTHGFSGRQSDGREAFLSRLDAETGPAALFRNLTSLLLDYLESSLSRDKMDRVYASPTRLEFAQRLEELTGKDLMDMGADMYAFGESRSQSGDASVWDSFPAGPFLVQVHPGSRADADRALIARQLAAAAGDIADALDLKSAFEAARRALKPVTSAAPGLIPVRLFDSRKEEGAAKIRKESQGSATLGATIADKKGILTFRIEVLYWDALSLAVLEHEAAHAVVLLSSFDLAELTEAPLSGEADLRKAFFAGYRKIPAFLEEGISDWSFYYRGIQKGWGLLPAPDNLVAGLEAKGKTLPLSKLLAGDAHFSARNRKVYSLQAASFIDFLLRTAGKGKLKAWLFSGQTDASRTFAGVFGMPLGEAESAWKAGRTGAIQ
jgi:hypothetical protein